MHRISMHKIAVNSRFVYVLEMVTIDCKKQHNKCNQQALKHLNYKQLKTILTNNPFATRIVKQLIYQCAIFLAGHIVV